MQACQHNLPLPRKMTGQNQVKLLKIFMYTSKIVSWDAQEKALTSSYVKEEKNMTILAIYYGSLIVTMGDYLLSNTLT